MLVVEEAYAEFAAGAGYETGFDLVDAGRNVVVLRTFSKAYGLARLRVGWMYAPGDVIDSVGRVRPPNTVIPAGLATAEAALRGREHLDRVIGASRGSRSPEVEGGERGRATQRAAHRHTRRFGHLRFVAAEFIENISHVLVRIVLQPLYLRGVEIDIHLPLSP